MSDSSKNTRTSLEEAKVRLELLEELELLESEFVLITNEYHQRKRHLEERLSLLSAN